MVMKQRLDQRQVQKLILAPALQQAIKLLPLTNLELVEVIDEELEANPLLELEGEAVEKKAEEAPDALAGGSDKEDKSEPAERSQAEEGGVEEPGDEDREFETYFQEYIDDGFRAAPQERPEVPNLENIVSRGATLWDHLTWQASLTFFDDAERAIADWLIGNINEDGLLTQIPEEVAQALGAPLENVESVRSKIMTFDPVGCGSRDLKECLLVQMDHLQIKDEAARAIITQHLHLVERSDFAQIAKALGASLSDVRYHLEVIKGLDPAPGRKYSLDRPAYVVPDILVQKEGDHLRISLNDEGIPRLRINAYYRQLLAKALKDNPEAYRYLKDKMKKALWFLRSLDQRDQTIYKVASAVVERQRDFLEKGIEGLRPLTLLEIAQEIGVHESTVGRVVANKFILTPRGTFSLKYFFHKSLHGETGEEISTLRIKDRIRHLVDLEDKGRPLSDMEIEEVLRRENFRLARRTVAKYRQQLGIPPSHIRKRKFLMEESS
ncbi:MAG: RNA polymerase factor sigma-54 [Candidatus Aminicenantes bacterium]|nr:RNA polymerase factor sigma-54 [Candidatus Aminicenantes bacterium]